MSDRDGFSQRTEPEILDRVPGHNHKTSPAVVDSLTKEQVEALLDGKVLYWDMQGGVCLVMDDE